MLKGVLRGHRRDDGGSDEGVVLLGLTGENMTRLMADEPILIDLAELGLPPQRILIVGSRDDESLENYVVDTLIGVAENP